MTGDLVFDGYDTVGAAPFTQPIAYVAGDTLDSLAAKINADATLSGAIVNITAQVVKEGRFLSSVDHGYER